MKRGWHFTALFTVGLFAGAFAVLGAYLKWFPLPAVPGAGPVDRVHAVAQAPAAPAPAQAIQVQAAPAAGSCPAQALVPPAGEDDGRFTLEAALASSSRPEPAAFLAVAREAASQGRPRDAEVAMLAACHASEQASGARSAPAADIKSQVGQRYADIAARAESEVFRQALLQRATALLSESAEAYAGALGRNASKTRMAQQRLAVLSDAAGAGNKGASAAAPRGRAPGGPDTASMGSARASLAQRPIARHEDLGQVDHDLDRLYAQARAVSRDPRGLQRRHQQALAQRAACNGDERCLRHWVAQRRSQLFAEF